METENPKGSAALLKFLLELVQGQWNVVLKDWRMPDEKEANPEMVIEMLAGLLADELRSLVLHQAYVNPHRRYGILQYGLFLLDGDFTIRAISSDAAGFIGKSPVSLYKSDFAALLTPESQKQFYAVAANETGKSVEALFLELLFYGPLDTILKAQCFVTPLLYKNQLLTVSLYALQPRPLLAQGAGDNDGIKRIPIVQQVYDYILKHEEGALPTTRMLARQFGTNEFELKRLFKKTFGTSIYQSYMELRLRKAYRLIEGTVTPLTEIAEQCGFLDYSNFARAFRKYYGLSPAKARESFK
jgi:AraC-like DNA-binding protein